MFVKAKKLTAHAVPAPYRRDGLLVTPVTPPLFHWGGQRNRPVPPPRHVAGLGTVTTLTAPVYWR